MTRRHGAREQKKAAKQKAKRNARQKQLARQSSADPNIRLKTADRWPITASLVPQDLWTGGLGNLIFASRMPDGMLACAVFLVDVFCLGVKNALWQIISPAEIKQMVAELEESGGPFETVSPEHFSKLIHCAADYGQSLGFPPHHDFRHARLLLAGIDPSLHHGEFQFGQGGRPFYVRGPNESVSRAREIADQVHALGGDFMISDAGFDSIGPSDELFGSRNAFDLGDIAAEGFTPDDFYDDDLGPEENIIDV